MSVFCNLGRTPWVYRAFSYQRLCADAEKGPMQIALSQSDICEFESYMPSHAVRCSGFSMTATRATWGAASLSTSSDFTATLSGGCAAGCGPRQGRLALRPP